MGGYLAGVLYKETLFTRNIDKHFLYEKAIHLAKTSVYYPWAGSSYCLGALQSKGRKTGACQGCLYADWPTLAPFPFEGVEWFCFSVRRPSCRRCCSALFHAPTFQLCPLNTVGITLFAQTVRNPPQQKSLSCWGRQQKMSFHHQPFRKAHKAGGLPAVEACRGLYNAAESSGRQSINEQLILPIFCPSP